METLLKKITVKVKAPPPKYQFTLSEDSASRLYTILGLTECGVLGEELEQLWRDLREHVAATEAFGRITAK